MNALETLEDMLGYEVVMGRTVARQWTYEHTDATLKFPHPWVMVSDFRHFAQFAEFGDLRAWSNLSKEERDLFVDLWDMTMENWEELRDLLNTVTRTV